MRAVTQISEEIYDSVGMVGEGWRAGGRLAILLSLSEHTDETENGLSKFGIFCFYLVSPDPSMEVIGVVACSGKIFLVIFTITMELVSTPPAIARPYELSTSGGQSSFQLTPSTELTDNVLLRRPAYVLRPTKMRGGRCCRLCLYSMLDLFVHL